MKERLLQFLEVNGISQRRFEKSIGVSDGYVNDMKSSLSPQLIQSILCVYPGLNKTWLISGEGDMCSRPIVSQKVGDILGNAQDVNVNGTVNINGEAVDRFLEEFAAQRRITEKYMDQMNRIIKLLEDKI